MSRARKLAQIDSLIIHCAATPNGQWHTVEDIDFWHGPDREEQGMRPFRRNPQVAGYHMPHLHHIGYHFVIYTTGHVACGRRLDETGAHCLDKQYVRGDHRRGRYNRTAIATCLIGTDKFTQEQWQILAKHVMAFQRDFPEIQILGHRQIDQGKTCPGFDVPTWLKGGMKPMEDHLHAS
ncbi:MAG: N-acetylmuramoyl-L-alanine amidase [Chromatiales bacterium]|nr:N-acetylmuramoyl-L-alanine amidase [Gammaproteobacteria bacterium]